MLLKLQNHLANNFPFLKDQKLLMTVSGGIDSIVLTYLFNKLGYNIGIAHCNFQLRAKDSDGDELFVENFATENSIPFHVIKFNTKEYCEQNKVSTQIGARELRYNWFTSLCTDFNYDYILTAHHLNDVMETFFINLSRGTGIDGLTGIPPINKNIIRPLLPFSRKEIETFAIDNSIAWREDKSNAETKYLRNKIRHRIVPELYKLTPNFEENFKTTIANIHQSKEFIEAKILALKTSFFKVENDIINIQKSKLETLSNFEIYELFKPYGFSSSSEIVKILQAQTGKKTSSNTHTLLVNRDVILLHPNRHQEKESYLIHNFKELEELPIQLSISSTKTALTPKTIALNLDKIQFPLVLRKWQEGDYFYPTGMRGKKKISKYFKDLKLSTLEKEACWLLCNTQDKIIWVIGHRADRTQTENTEKENLVYLKKQ